MIVSGEVILRPKQNSIFCFHQNSGAGFSLADTKCILKRLFSICKKKLFQKNVQARFEEIDRFHPGVAFAVSNVIDDANEIGLGSGESGQGCQSESEVERKARSSGVVVKRRQASATRLANGDVSARLDDCDDDDDAVNVQVR